MCFYYNNTHLFLNFMLLKKIFKALVHRHYVKGPMSKELGCACLPFFSGYHSIDWHLEHLVRNKEEKHKWKKSVC